MENLRQVAYDVVTLRRSRARLGIRLSRLGTLGHFHQHVLHGWWPRGAVVLEHPCGPDEHDELLGRDPRARLVLFKHAICDHRSEPGDLDQLVGLLWEPVTSGSPSLSDA